MSQSRSNQRQWYGNRHVDNSNYVVNENNYSPQVSREFRRREVRQTGRYSLQYDQNQQFEQRIVDTDDFNMPTQVTFYPNSPLSNTYDNRMPTNRPLEQERNVSKSNNNNKNKQRTERQNTQKDNQSAQTTVYTGRLKNHLATLKIVFDRIIIENFLSIDDLEESLRLYNKFRDVILSKRSDALIVLYGSVSFGCCLKDSPTIDVDLKFHELDSYDTLKNVMTIAHDSGLYQDIRLNTDHDPCCVELTLPNKRIFLRVTSNFKSGVYSSEIVRLYTRFDPRVLPLLRLFRYFVKICSLDKPEIGTLHPLVYHLMLIHFLQQLIPPVLPCLHEYVLGIDNALAIPSDDEFIDFFRICEDYINKWKSENNTPIELLFLQLLAYYVSKFSITKYIVSIQTRVPTIKSEKHRIRRNLFCADPMFIHRNLCYTMKATVSYKYFRQVFVQTLQYLCKIDPDNKEKKTTLSTEVQRTCKTLFSQLLSQCTRESNTLQEDLKKGFIKISNDCIQPQMILKDQNSMSLIDEEDNNDDDFDDASDDDSDTNSDLSDEDDRQANTQRARSSGANRNANDTNAQQQDNSNSESVRIDSSTTDDQVEKPVDVDEIAVLDENRVEQPILLHTLLKNLSETQRDILTIEYRRLVQEFNEKLRTIVDGFEGSATPATPESPTIPIATTTDGDDKIQSDNKVQPSNSVSCPLTVAYTKSIQLDDIITGNTRSLLEAITLDSSVQPVHKFTAASLGAENGAPLVCTYCFQDGHSKRDCFQLETRIPSGLQSPEPLWLQTLSSLCQRLADVYKPAQTEIEARETILKLLTTEFQKKYSNSTVCAYGSFYNGFGSRQSDLDVCVQTNVKNGQATLQILDNLAKSMSSTRNTFENIRVIRSARVPIIKSRHKKFNIDIDVSLNNTLPIENTRLLKTYTDIDPRVHQIGYLMKYLVKKCDIGDASRGTLSSYAYTIMVIHFLQQVQPPVIPVLQQLCDSSSNAKYNKRTCSGWDVYFYDDLTKLKKIWKGYGQNTMSTGALWIELLKYFTEQFDYRKNVISIRQYEPLSRSEKGWFHSAIAIEDPFLLTHNLADKLASRNWIRIHRVLLNARQKFNAKPYDIDIDTESLNFDKLQEILFNKTTLCFNANRKQRQGGFKMDTGNQSRQKPKQSNWKKKEWVLRQPMVRNNWIRKTEHFYGQVPIYDPNLDYQ